MTKQALVFAALTALTSTVATAQPQRGVDPRETAGTWSGKLSGTFMGQPYADVVVVPIAADGRSATTHDDSTIGPTTSTCTLTSFTADGLGLVHCTFTSGAATGGTFDVHYAYTDGGQRLALWVLAANPDPSSPAPLLLATGDLTRP